MAISATQPMIGQVFVDEFVFGGKEDLKQGRSNDSKKKKSSLLKQLILQESKEYILNNLMIIRAKKYVKYLINIFQNQHQ